MAAHPTWLVPQCISKPSLVEARGTNITCRSAEVSTLGLIHEVAAGAGCQVCMQGRQERNTTSCAQASYQIWLAEKRSEAFLSGARKLLQYRFTKCCAGYPEPLFARGLSSPCHAEKKNPMRQLRQQSFLCACAPNCEEAVGAGGL